MSGWSTSAIFGAFAFAPLLSAAANNGGATGYGGLVADAINVALFNNTTTPDKTAAVANTGYNTGQWVTANECTDATNWVAGGRPLGTKALNSISGGASFTAANLAGGGPLTLANVYGCLVYDNAITGGTVAKQGVCFNYLGGVQNVSAGTFTVVWNASGVFQLNM